MSECIDEGVRAIRHLKCRSGIRFRNDAFLAIIAGAICIRENWKCMHRARTFGTIGNVLNFEYCHIIYNGLGRQ